MPQYTGTNDKTLMLSPDERLDLEVILEANLEEGRHSLEYFKLEEALAAWGLQMWTNGRDEGKIDAGY